MPILGQPMVAHALADLIDFGVREVVVLVDRAVEVAIADAVRNVPAGPASVNLVCRDPELDLPEAIDAARRTVGDGPFLLRFTDCIGRSGLQEQIGELALDEFDAVALTSRFGAPGEMTAVPAALEGPPLTSDFHVGVFALGSGFPPASLDRQTASSTWMDRALERMEERGGRVERRLVTGWWRHRGEQDAILAGNSFVLAGIEDMACDGASITSDVAGAVRCHPSARVESSVVRGPVWIAAGAEITDAFIGPFTVIGRDVCVSNAEIENSVILEGSTVTDIGDRLDSSVIGPRATITRDFRIPRGTRLDVGPGASVSF